MIIRSLMMKPSTNFSFYSVRTVILFIALSFLALCISCEKELSVDPIPRLMKIVGVVSDSASGAPIENASVSIFPLSGGKVSNGVTKSDGSFEISVDLIPNLELYKVEVIAIGYYTTFVIESCACDKLDIKPIKLTRIMCAVSLQPKSLDFGYVATGSDSTLNFKIVNPSTMLPVTITRLEILQTRSDLSLIDTFPPSGIFLPKLGEVTLQLKYIPSAAIDEIYMARVVAYSDCGTKDTMTIIAKAEKPLCTYTFVPNPLSLGQLDIARVIIKNISAHVDLKVTYSYYPLLPFKSTPQIPSTIVKKGDSAVTVIVFEPLTDGTFRDSIIISTDGNCGQLVVPIIGIYSTSGFRTSVLYKWSPSLSTNPDYLFKGFRFKDQQLWDDQNNYCRESIDTSGWAIPRRDSADFRFDGYFISGWDDYGYIKADNGLQVLGNIVSPSPQPFDIPTWKPKIGSNWNDKGCSTSFKEGDVIVIRTAENRWALIQIEMFEKKLGTPYQYVMFNYFPDVGP